MFFALPRAPARGRARPRERPSEGLLRLCARTGFLLRGRPASVAVCDLWRKGRWAETDGRRRRRRMAEAGQVNGAEWRARAWRSTGLTPVCFIQSLVRPTVR